MHRPLIGLTLDWENSTQYASVPWYALRQNYAEIVSKVGGIPIMLPHDQEAVERYANIIDGLIITGGHFDIPPHMYGDGEAHSSVKTKDARTNFEWNLGKNCFAMQKPILGICGGMQLMNVILGGTLIQDIETFHPGGQNHLQKPPYHDPHHLITLKEGSLLHKLAGKMEIEVNSSHHQAVGRLAQGFQATAHAPDGIVEAIEHTDQYCVGVQWHPEYEVSSFDTAIVESFVAACQKSV